MEQFFGLTPNLERHARLAALSPAEAMRAFVEGDFGLGEESALFHAIRRDPGVTLSDDELFDRLADQMGQGGDPEALLASLRQADGDRRR